MVAGALFTLVTNPSFRSSTRTFTNSITTMPPKKDESVQNKPSTERKRKPSSPADKSGNDAKRTNLGNPTKEEDPTQAPSDAQLIDTALLEIAAKVGDCMDSQEEVADTLSTHSDQLTESKKEIADLKNQNKVLSKQLSNMGASLKAVIERVGEVEKTANSNSQTLKNANLVIEGLEEKSGENCRKIVHDLLHEIESKCQSGDIISAYRIGQVSTEGKYVRPVVVKMIDTLSKVIIMENKWKLTKLPKYKNIYINDDLPPQIKKERKTLREISKFANKIGYKNCKATGSKLVIDGKTYRYETLHLLPQELQMCNVKTRYVGEGLGFQGEESFLSNFYPVTIEMEQLSFSSAEQAYQFFKTRTCKRDDTAAKIMATSNPRVIKTAGDSIGATAVWESNKYAFMRSIVYNKFVQNPELGKKLLDTLDTPLYECTKNRWWGCGLRFDAPEWEKKTFPGLNHMGNILMEVRSAIRSHTFKEDAYTKSPSAIIKSMKKLNEQVQSEVRLATGEQLPQTNEEIAAKSLSFTEEVKPEEDNEVSDSSSDMEGLLEATDVEEESVDISVESVSSSSSSARRHNITNAEGKLDLEKIKGWSIPKIKQSSPTSKETKARRSQRVRNSVQSASSSSLSTPQAQSTPQHDKLNRSMTLQRVRDTINRSSKK